MRCAALGRMAAGNKKTPWGRFGRLQGVLGMLDYGFGSSVGAGVTWGDLAGGVGCAAP